MSERSVFFAGGATGGHIYPALAVAEQIRKLQPSTRIHFFCSNRRIDERILGRTSFEYTKLPAVGLSARPWRLIGFADGFRKSCRLAEPVLAASSRPIVVGVGGYVAAPVCWAAHKLAVPVVLINVDLVPGRANRFVARFAERIFVQFEETRPHFGRQGNKVTVVGCPLREGFADPRPQDAIDRLKLDKNKKVLLVTGASSGADSINNTICSLLPRLAAFADDWQVVHLTGRTNLDKVKRFYEGAAITHRILDYYDGMPQLLSASDLVVGRSGAVSVAEYAAAGVPSICMPYPHHRDMHQYRNAATLVEAGAAVIVEDLPDDTDRAERLWKELQQLMRDDGRRRRMAGNCRSIARVDAARLVAEGLLGL